MVPKAAADVLGFEFDWLCSDAKGHVALFSTAGGAYAPEKVLQDADAQDAAIAVILALPASTAARLSPGLPSSYQNTWRLAAERGLFAYDADFHCGPYRLVAAPLVPIHVAELPRIACAAAAVIEISSATFLDLPVISADLLRQSK
jgi:hypothetical protein